MNNKTILALLCVLGLGACYFSNKYGPINFNRSRVDVVPPGWTPQIQPINPVQPVTPPLPVPPQSQPNRT